MNFFKRKEPPPPKPFETSPEREAFLVCYKRFVIQAAEILAEIERVKFARQYFQYYKLFHDEILIISTTFVSVQFIIG